MAANPVESTERRPDLVSAMSQAAQGAGLTPEMLAEFARLFLRRADDRYTRRLSDPQMGGTLGRMCSFAARRSPDELLLRVTAPQEEALDPLEEVVAVETCMTDQPFIVDTLRMGFAAAGLKEVAGVTVIVWSARDAQGRITSLRGADAPDHVSESCTRFLLTGARGPAERERIAAEIRARLEVSMQAVRDYNRVRRSLRDLANAYEFQAQSTSARGPAAAEIEEAREFLNWLLDDRFLFMAGAELSAGAPAPGAALGAAAAILPAGDALYEHARRFLAAPAAGTPVLRVWKCDQESSMHRPGKLDAACFRRFDDNGRPAGGLLLVGLFTRRALAELRSSMPLLRKRLELLYRADDVRPGTYLYKALTNAFNAAPMEYLFEATDAQLLCLMRKLMDAEARREIVAHVDIDAARKNAHVFAAVIKEEFSETILERLRSLVTEQLQAGYCDYQVGTGKGQTVSVYLFLSGCANADEGLEERLPAQLISVCTPWRERLRVFLSITLEEERVKQLYAEYADAFPPEYMRSTEPSEAAGDVVHLHLLRATGTIQFDLLPGAAAPDEVRLRLYRPGRLFLSEVVPMLDDFGFRVLDQYPTEITASDGTLLRMDTFRLLVDRESGEVEYVANKERLLQGLRAIFERHMISDPLNRLMLRPGLTWEDVDCLRAYLGYSLQIGPFFAADVAQRVLSAHPVLTGALVDLFQARFNPRFGAADGPGRKQRMESARRAVTEGLARIQDAAEDRVLRTFLNLIDATRRTNAFQPARKGHYLSFKFECAKLDRCPEPRPLFEIYVHHAEMEGVHLRGGRVARGGIRWSDRLEDYRTEIFGLMRTQMVKNVLIVPVGAKGGFVVKGKPPAGMDRKAYGDAMYKVLIRGMLDITDNRVAGAPVRPADVVCHDEYDPYLVVAADKGTAHLSDTANALSAEYGFWLDDAFASGGSAGYDHKIEGITARGAWACVRHHFAEIGLDPERDVIRVVGIGDLAGDVFGNGALRSRTMKLVGAFNHLHIFLDPDPDPAASFAERERMFRLPRSSWTDYQKAVISSGGGVWLRTEKAVPLSPEVQRMLGVKAATLPGSEVVKRLLTLDVDLLYNGGIGTYIKASDETSAEVGDKVNDPVRVDARDVRAKVIGEGGNLGMTQRARIEYALRGGRVNTDAIDNSGGVDLSDHEVNLKILVGPLTAAGEMTRAERDKLLRELCPEVCGKVIDDNAAHSLMLSLDELRSRHDPYRFLRTVEFLEQKGVMTAELERLPLLPQLQGRGMDKGFARPELSRLDAFVKMYVFGELVKLEVGNFPHCEEMLADYFPAAIYEQHRKTIERHLLLREILATVWTNRLVQFAGGAFFPDLMLDTERGAVDVALAYGAAEAWLDGAAQRSALLALSGKGAPAAAIYAGLVAVEDGLREATSWLLHFYPGAQLAERIGNVQELDRSAQAYRTARACVRKSLAEAAPSAEQRIERETAALVKAQLPAGAAAEVAFATQWSKAFPVAELARRAGSDVCEVARTYLTCGQHTGLNALVLRIGRQVATDPYEAQALRSLRASLLRTLLALAEKALARGLEATLKREAAFAEVGVAVTRIKEKNAPVSVPMLVVLGERLHKALARV
ncbi:MAG: NAD-glutamate dehydrogenase [Planctomycetes bacterium]|nr:NAD-glutamate dehydrogenase [Planctomycetota bacterium]